MTPADLARALVAAPWWEWRAGMRAVHESGHAVVLVRRGDGVRYTNAIGIFAPARPTKWPAPDVEWLPDLSDDATAGVLVGMLREAVPGWTVEILMLRAYVEVCVGSPGSGGRTVHVDTSLGRAAARAWLAVPRT